ncbi:hypothetical protein [Streptococcus oriscaviae]|uniref:Uncharacterized protein n=1 Tax=Streptococcus oriscaviae TaxID=2781599 RepID=A0ABX7YN94_9STRE|nr:hypothetical protein [Streptococcus oriscaviae]QUE55215.1 hypothetical protein INT76_04900 [Streptococcus oriscaviae]
MIGIYKGKKYTVSGHLGNNIFVVYSDIKEVGFKNAISPWGKVYDDYFSKEVNESDLDYLYELSYELKYKDRWFHLYTALNTRTITEDYYEIILDFLDVEEKKLAEELDFERTDKFYYTKRIYRKDIEELKVIESPQGIFSSQGKKEIILQGEAIDAYLSEIVHNDGVK